MARRAKPKDPKGRVVDDARAGTSAVTAAPTAAPAGAAPLLLEEPRPLERAVLDRILALQLLVAWAGEGNTDPPRLGWWRTSLADEFGGEDLFRRLTPRTWRWAVLETARVAARTVDAEVRSHAAPGDHLVSLFHFGFVLDEQLDDRLAELKRSAAEPAEAMPELGAMATPWDAAGFLQGLGALAEVSVAPSSVGSRLKGEMPSDPVAASRMLAAALATAPASERYPAPYFKVERA